MSINYESPSVKIVSFYAAQIMCLSTGSWEDVDRDDDDNW
jgi:hypothetical protein